MDALSAVQTRLMSRWHDVSRWITYLNYTSQNTSPWKYITINYLIEFGADKLCSLCTPASAVRSLAVRCRRKFSDRPKVVWSNDRPARCSDDDSKIP